ncbi:unnamed protein product, partial [Ixodes hexagonus]
MTTKLQGMTSTFRKSFQLAPKDMAKWFPTHMYTGMKDMQRKLKSVDCILELHDARISFFAIAGRNPNFARMLTAVKPHLLLLNKRDLADPDMEQEVVRQLQAQGVPNVLHIRSSDPTENINKIVPIVANMIRNSERFNRREEYDYNIMVIGIPNVGKSSLINSLRTKHLGRKGQATRVGARAGVTMSVLERIRISQEPSMYLLDTPGVLCPTVKDPVVALQLALCSCMPDHLVGVMLIADYLLYWLNQNNNYRQHCYVDYLGLEGPCDDIRLVLYQAAIMARSTVRRRTHEGWSIRPNLDAAAQQFIRGFRQGLFGRVIFDPPPVTASGTKLYWPSGETDMYNPTMYKNKGVSPMLRDCVTQNSSVPRVKLVWQLRRRRRLQRRPGECYFWGPSGLTRLQDLWLEVSQVRPSNKPSPVVAHAGWTYQLRSRIRVNPSFSWISCGFMAAGK